MNRKRIMRTRSLCMCAECIFISSKLNISFVCLQWFPWQNHTCFQCSAARWPGGHGHLILTFCTCSLCTEIPLDSLNILMIYYDEIFSDFMLFWNFFTIFCTLVNFSPSLLRRNSASLRCRNIPDLLLINLIIC